MTEQTPSRADERRRINGQIVRNVNEECDGCDAAEQEWCRPGCERLDVMDYR